jgi:sec-independent protein translocase protein TatA
LDITPVHLLIVLLIVLVLFGARRLPELGRSLGTSAREFKKGISGDESTPTPAPPPEAPAQPVDTHDVEQH